MTTPYQPSLDQGSAGLPQPPVASPMIVPQEMVPAVRGVTAFLSAQVRAGDWILPRLFRAVSFMGDVKIDLTSARFGAGSSRIAFMGSVEVKIVNPNAPSWIKMLRTRWNEARGLSAGQP